MPAPIPFDARFGPVRVAVLPHPPRTPGESVARAWLGVATGHAPAALPLGRDAHGRPSLQLPGLDANWSHSGERLAVALGRGVRVGVDIESPRPRPRAIELAGRYFTASEAEALAALAPATREAAFLRLWCAKEAVLKAHGRGLAFGLDRLRFDRLDALPRLVAVDPGLGAVGDWQVEALAIEGLVGAVAWRRGDAPG